MPETILNLFETEPDFTLVEMTTAMNLTPYVPRKLGALGLFVEKPHSTLAVALEEKAGLLTVVHSQPRGTPAPTLGKSKRTLRLLNIPHFPLNASLKAEDIQNLRAFGSGSVLDSVNAKVADILQDLRNAFEVTREWLRLGALKGLVLDAPTTAGDPTTCDTLLDLFEAYDLTQTEVDFDLDDDTTKVRAKCLAVVRAIETALGGSTYSTIHAYCGANFFDAFVDHPAVRQSWLMFRESELLRNNPRGGFNFGGIDWEEYPGKIGGIDCVDSDSAHFFPIGVPDLFTQYNAPANFVETVNTPGEPFYVRQKLQDYNMGVDFHSQMNTIALCRRPSCLIKGNK